MRNRILGVMTMAMVAGVAGVTPALAHGAHAPGGGGTKPGGAAPAPALVTVPATGKAVTLAAELSGAHEVPVHGGPAVNDPDAKAVAVVTVRGDRVTFALQWKGLVPTLGHIHEGGAGKNGAVKVPLFGSAMPDTVHSAAGQTAVTDAKLAERIRTDPAGFYVNLHSAEFPGGAVRGQLKPIKKHISPLEVIKGGTVRGISDGGQEVPKNDTSKVGDPDGHAVTFLHPKGTAVDYSLAWIGIQSPSKGHIHRGASGTNGDVVFDLFNRPVPDGIFAVSGRLGGQDAEAVLRLRKHPADYYSNIHTPEFPDGAVRGQLFG